MFFLRKSFYVIIVILLSLDFALSSIVFKKTRFWNHNLYKEKTWRIISKEYHHDLSPFINEIEKWAYASDANATDVGDILFIRANVGAASSQSYGYCMGGKNPPYNNIEKYSFTTDGNSTDVGDLTATKGSTCGTQI